jgi:hypothetical protein
MGNRLDRLVSAAGPALSARTTSNTDIPRTLADDLSTLLKRRNGFYAFESALHVFPAGPAPADTVSVQQWNSHDLWRYSYGDLAKELFFFAEDAFGVQFALRAGSVVIFEPETGKFEELAEGIEGWADKILTDYACLTGYPLAHDWQVQHGRLLPGKRLLPKRPFVLGGGYSVGNLYALDAADGMRLRGDLAVQLKDLPDGATIRFTVLE